MKDTKPGASATVAGREFQRHTVLGKSCIYNSHWKLGSACTSESALVEFWSKLALSISLLDVDKCNPSVKKHGIIYM